MLTPLYQNACACAPAHALTHATIVKMMVNGEVSKRDVAGKSMPRTVLTGEKHASC